MTDNSSPAEQVLETLRDVMQSSESDTARIAAAKILLERLAPKEEDDANRREAEERDRAIAEARGLLAEFAALKLAGLHQPGEMGETGEADTDHAGRELARLAHHGGARLGENQDGG